MSKYDDLVKKLKEIFQIDKPELDFGVYRILNARSAEINDYLENRLKAKVLESLSQAGSANVENLKYDLAEAEKNAVSLGVSPDSVPKVLELRQRIAECSTGSSEHENAVFSHLLTFFSRYYDSGDFISQRRYKGDTYAIPYAGEEVMLHWANKDQYYTKSGENFSNYAFKLDDGRSVRFKLVTADTAKDNRKDNDKERRFVLIEEKIQTLLDDEGDEYEETLMPIEEMNDELVIHFEYKAMPKGSKQEDEIAKAIKTILESEIVRVNWVDLAKREPTESNPKRTLLEKCLANYTSKNTADYFIHKDLGRFFRGELDFYIKNEVMNLDDVQNAEKFSDIEKNLRLIQTLRSIALDLITFLAQLEDFQRKLWLKKKFVISSNYCITLDRIPESLYACIASNEQQWGQWETLGMLDGNKTDLFNQAKSGNVEYLKTHPYLMADTSLFDAGFKFDLLNQLDSVDEKLDGLLIHGDNFQALQILKSSFQQKIGCVYIDPPYNAPNSEIAYKNNFKHSSFLSLIENRLSVSSKFTNEYGSHVIAIDKNEKNAVERLVGELFPFNDNVSVTVEHNRKGVQDKHFSFTNEFAIFSIPLLKKDLNQLPKLPDDYEWSNFRNWGGESLRTDAANCFYAVYVKNEEIVGFGDVWTDLEKHPDSANVSRGDGVVEVYPIDNDNVERKWRYERGTVEAIVSKLRVEKNRNGLIQIKLAKVSDQFKTVWYSPKYNAGDNGTQVAKQMGLPLGKFDYPKSIFTTKDCIYAVSSDNDWILDYFAGSGTTAQSTILLNREIKTSNRKYILVEQGEYFDTVTKARVSKFVYSAEWKDGQPTKPDTGISHAFKVLKLESYEDTLNNLQLVRSEKQQDLINSLPKSAKDDYLLSYMLNIETSGSLISIENFNTPFDFKLKVAVDSAGAYEERSVDLVETFNYLIGLRVKHFDMQYHNGFVTVIGELPNGAKTLVLWRDVNKVDYSALNNLCDKLAINPSDNEFDIVYINGDHNIPTAFTSTEAEGGVTKSLALRQIEPEFLNQMFTMDNV